MNRQRSEQLIDSLVNELSRVPNRSRLWPPLLLWAAGFAILVISSLAFASIITPQSGWSHHLLNPAFLLALLPAIPSGVWAITLSLPGRRTAPWQTLTILFFVLWGAYLLIDIWRQPHATEAMTHWQSSICILDILLIGILPFLFLFTIIRNRFVLNREASAIALFLSSSLAASACTGIICTDHSSAHVLQEHYLPVTALLFILLLVQSKLKR